MAARVRDIDRGWLRIQKDMQRLRGQYVDVGLFEDKRRKRKPAEYGFYNEFGTKNIPSRPFMRMTFDESKEELQNKLRFTVGNILSGATPLKEGLKNIGEFYAIKIRKKIEFTNILPKLKEATIKKKKGSTKTLIDTGLMLRSVKFKVRRKKD